MASWRSLLHRTVSGLQALEASGVAVPSWRLGGGTALMLWLEHRLSNDIDAFIDDPQLLGGLDPSLATEDVWRCTAHDRQAHYLKLSFPEGEVDFIAAPAVTDLSPVGRMIEGHAVRLDQPVEIAVSKLFHRPRSLKVRDILDVAAVDAEYAIALSEHLHRLGPMKGDLQARLAEIVPDFYAVEVTEIAVLDGWQHLAGTALDRVREIVAAIPDPA